MRVAMFGRSKRGGIGSGHALGVWVAVIGVGVSAGCAPKQKIPLDCVPREVDVYVDGERLDEIPAELTLRSDQPHTVFVKGPGIEPELVVLEHEEVEGRWLLSPPTLCVQPRLLEVRRELEIEIDRDVSAAPPSDEEDADGAVEVAPRPEFTPGSG
jgi:hypothetical protein